MRSEGSYQTSSGRRCATAKSDPPKFMILRGTLVCITTSKKSLHILRRSLTTALHRAMHTGGPVLLEGPSGSGKTFLVRSQFPRLRYISLRDAADRHAARRDPEAFTARLRGRAFIDD